MEQSKEDLLAGRLIKMSDDGEVQREQRAGTIDYTLTIDGKDYIVRVIEK